MYILFKVSVSGKSLSHVGQCPCDSQCGCHSFGVSGAFVVCDGYMDVKMLLRQRSDGQYDE